MFSCYLSGDAGRVARSGGGARGGGWGAAPNLEIPEPIAFNLLFYSGTHIEF
jgi:hypothetical protein